MRRRARYRCDLVDEPDEHFAIVPFSDGDRGLAAILLFHAAGGRTRRHGGPAADDVFHDRLAGERRRGGVFPRFVPPFQNLALLCFVFFYLGLCCVFVSRVGLV